MQPLLTGLRKNLGIRGADTTQAELPGPAAPAPGPDADIATPALNADLIAALPRSPLEIFLPATPRTALEPPPQFQWTTFGSPGAAPWRDTPRAGAGLIRNEGLKEQAIGGARDAGSEVTLGAAATAHNIAQRAREKGLSGNEVAQLEKTLREGLFAGDAELVSTLLESGNAADAVRTFLDLQLFRSIRPDRLTPDVMRTLTLGVGVPRTAAGEGREGILNRASALRAARALGCMSPDDYDMMKLMLAEAGTGFTYAPAAPGADAQTERALILKAVAARDGELGIGAPFKSALDAKLDIVRFAIHIRGMDAQRLIEITSPIDLDGDGADEALQQNWQNASAPAVLQILRAEYDPIYAWSMHTVPVAPKPGQWFTDKVPVTSVADEQAAMLEKQGTEATPRGDDRFAGSGMVSATMANAVDPRTGKAFERVTIVPGTLTKALEDIESLVRAGRDVAIAVGAAPGQRHAMVITDVRGNGPGTEFLVTDPWTGRTEWVAPLAMAAGHFDGASLTDYWR